MRRDRGLERVDPALDLGQLLGQQLDHPAGELGHAGAGSAILASSRATCHGPWGSITPNSARWPRNALLSWVRCRTRVRAYGGRSAPPAARALDRDEAHRRPAHRLADRRRIGRVVLAAPDVGPDVLRRHQAHLVAKRAQLARPEVGPGAGLQPDEAGGRWAKKPSLGAAQTALDHDATRRIDAMHPKDMLGEVETDRGNLHADGPCWCVRSPPVWHSDAGRGPSTPSAPAFAGLQELQSRHLIRRRPGEYQSRQKAFSARLPVARDWHGRACGGARATRACADRHDARAPRATAGARQAESAAAGRVSSSVTIWSITLVSW